MHGSPDMRSIELSGGTLGSSSISLMSLAMFSVESSSGTLHAGISPALSKSFSVSCIFSSPFLVIRIHDY